MAAEYADNVLQDLDAMVRGSLAHWGLSPETECGLLNISENATYRLYDPRDERTLVLRIHRLGYHALEEIHSELAWINALRAGKVIQTPPPVPGVDGSLVHTLVSPTGRAPRYAVAFEFARGSEPEPNADLAPSFHTLGALTARMHRHVRAWQPPQGFVRKIWNFDTMFGDQPHWGHWSKSLGLTPDGTQLLVRALDLINKRLSRFGSGPDRFGLVHADMRLANLLIDEPHIHVIDFDDCGMSWFLYDFATAVSFFEDDPIVPELMDAWVEGYRTVAPLSDEEKAELPTFVAARRILLTGWLAAHREVPIAQQLGTQFTVNTLKVADAFLSSAA